MVGLVRRRTAAQQWLDLGELLPADVACVGSSLHPDIFRDGEIVNTLYARLPEWGYEHKTVCHGAGEYARDDNGDGFHEVHVNTMEGCWSLLRSWLRPHRGISQAKLPLYVGFFQFVHNARRRGPALLTPLLGALLRPAG